MISANVLVTGRKSLAVPVAQMGPRCFLHRGCVFFRELLESGILIIFPVSIKNEYRSVGRSRRKGKPGAHLQKEGMGLI